MHAPYTVPPYLDLLGVPVDIDLRHPRLEPDLVRVSAKSKKKRTKSKRAKRKKGIGIGNAEAVIGEQRQQQF